eukprot:6466830-Amphidinium_carterae.1
MGKFLLDCSRLNMQGVSMQGVSAERELVERSEADPGAVTTGEAPVCVIEQHDAQNARNISVCSMDLYLGPLHNFRKEKTLVSLPWPQKYPQTIRNK